MVVVQAPARGARASTEAGAIRDAHRRRRRRVTIAAVGVLAAAALAAAFGYLGTQRIRSRGAGAQRLAFERARLQQRAGGWHISPALEGGEYGWCVREAAGGASCATLPVETTIAERIAGTVAGRHFVPIGSIASTSGAGHEARPLETAILLDAQRPGARPAPIPGMAPIPRMHATFNAPADWDGDITAVRHGNAWLVVAGGSGLPQRLEVLRHLTATIRSR
jgi:hypothetical protein